VGQRISREARRIDGFADAVVERRSFCEKIGRHRCGLRRFGGGGFSAGDEWTPFDGQCAGDDTYDGFCADGFIWTNLCRCVESQRKEAGENSLTVLTTMSRLPIIIESRRRHIFRARRIGEREMPRRRHVGNVAKRPCGDSCYNKKKKQGGGGEPLALG